jgi:hypothetical protein
MPACLGIGGPRNMPDLSPSRFDWVAQGNGTMGMSPIGPAFKAAGNQSLQQTAAAWGLPCKFHTNSVFDKMTMQAYFKFTHSGSAKTSTLFWSDNATAGAPQYYGYRLFVDNNTDQLKLMIANGDDNVTTFPAYYTSISTLTSNRWYHVVVTWTGLGRDGAGNDLASMFIDGVDEGYLTVTNAIPSGVEEFCVHSTARSSRIGSTLNSIAPDIEVALVNVWNRELAARELDDLYLDPVRMFRKRRPVWGKTLGRVTRNTRQTMNSSPGVGFMRMRRGG